MLLNVTRVNHRLIRKKIITLASNLRPYTGSLAPALLLYLTGPIEAALWLAQHEQTNRKQRFVF